MFSTLEMSERRGEINLEKKGKKKKEKRKKKRKNKKKKQVIMG